MERSLTILQTEMDPANPPLVVTLQKPNGEILYNGTNFVLFIPEDSQGKTMIGIAACTTIQLLHAADTIMNLLDKVIE